MIGNLVMYFDGYSFFLYLSKMTNISPLNQYIEKTKKN